MDGCHVTKNISAEGQKVMVTATTTFEVVITGHLRHNTKLTHVYGHTWLNTGNSPLSLHLLNSFVNLMENPVKNIKTRTHERTHMYTHQVMQTDILLKIKLCKILFWANLLKRLSGSNKHLFHQMLLQSQHQLQFTLVSRRLHHFCSDPFI